MKNIIINFSNISAIFSYGAVIMKIDTQYPKTLHHFIKRKCLGISNPLSGILTENM